MPAKLNPFLGLRINQALFNGDIEALTDNLVQYFQDNQLKFTKEQSKLLETEQQPTNLGRLH